jgi:hypothetical protein
LTGACFSYIEEGVVAVGERESILGEGVVGVLGGSPVFVIRKTLCKY